MIGNIDKENPSVVNKKLLDYWTKSKLVNYLQHQQDIEKGTSVSFDKLIAISKDNGIELTVVHYFGTDIANNYVDFKEISHKELYNFSGFVSTYDLNKNVLDIKR